MTAARGWDLPALRPGRPAPADLVERRAGLRAMAVATPAEGVEQRDIDWGGVPSLVFEPESARSTVLYLHGGGYRIGHPTMWVSFGSRLALETSSRVVVPDYRLAPEYPFPAALHDAAAAYDKATASGMPVVVGGDSAGGGLAAALTLACGRSAKAVPRGLVLVSPWVDLTGRATTYHSRRDTDQLFSLDAADVAADAYLQGTSAEESLASPLFGDLSGFPPSLVFGGGDEVLLADAVEFTARLALAGVTVESHFVAGMQHVWVTTESDLPERGAAFADVVRFVIGMTQEESVHQNLEVRS